MSDKKVSQLTAKATLDGTELVHVVSDPSGTPVDRKATAQAIADLVTVPTVPALASQAEAEAGVENTKIMTALRTAQAIAALGKKYYRAIIAQVGTSAPYEINFENMLGAVVSFSRVGVGQYTLETDENVLTLDKVFMNVSLYNEGVLTTNLFLIKVSQGDVNFINIATYKQNAASKAFELADGASYFFELIVYP